MADSSEEMRMIEHKQMLNKQFEIWLREVQKELPSLMTRVLKFNETSFAPSLYRNLGYIMRRVYSDIVNFWHGGEGAANQVMLKIVYEDLVEDLEVAECGRSNGQLAT